MLQDLFKPLQLSTVKLQVKNFWNSNVIWFCFKNTRPGPSSVRHRRVERIGKVCDRSFGNVLGADTCTETQAFTRMFATENCPKYQVRLSFEFLFIYSCSGGTSTYSGLTPNHKSPQFCIFSIKVTPLPGLRLEDERGFNIVPIMN
jgi:hypothetical protein